MMNYITNILSNMNNIIEKSEKSGALWLGDYKSALNPQFLKDENISVIINCSVDLPYVYDILDPIKHELNSLETFRIPVYDSLLEHDIYLMEKYFNKVLPFILKKLLKDKKNVLIHCRAGAQRSAVVVAAILFILVDNNILQINISNYEDRNELMKKVITYILERRPRAFSYGFRVNFKKSLERFFKLKI